MFRIERFVTKDPEELTLLRVGGTHMTNCERCGIRLGDSRSQVCRSCFAERERNRAALEREDSDRALLRAVREHPYSKVARQEGVSVAAVASRVKAATGRLELLDKLRREARS